MIYRVERFTRAWRIYRDVGWWLSSPIIYEDVSESATRLVCAELNGSAL